MSSYNIGYGKPPVSTRFQKGQSGNPKGRPKGAENKVRTEVPKLYQVILNGIEQTLPITENGKTVNKPVKEAFVRSLSLQATQGKTVGAMKLFSEIMLFSEREQDKIEAKLEVQRLQDFKDAYAYKEKMKQELYLEALGRIKLLERPLPHPDNVVLDINNLRWEIRGPYDEKTKNVVNSTMNLKRNSEKKIAYFEQAISDLSEADMRESYEEQLANAREYLDWADLRLMLLWKLLPQSLSDDLDRQEYLKEILELDYYERGEEMPWYFMGFI